MFSLDALFCDVDDFCSAFERVQIQVTLEIEASIPDGAPDDVVRTVMKNRRTLKFNRQAFEYE
jgi:hypothetical protein